MARAAHFPTREVSFWALIVSNTGPLVHFKDAPGTRKTDQHQRMFHGQFRAGAISIYQACEVCPQPFNYRLIRIKPLFWPARPRYPRVDCGRRHLQPMPAFWNFAFRPYKQVFELPSFIEKENIPARHRSKNIICQPG